MHFRLVSRQAESRSFPSDVSRGYLRLGEAILVSGMVRPIKLVRSNRIQNIPTANFLATVPFSRYLRVVLAYRPH